MCALKEDLQRRHKLQKHFEKWAEHLEAVEADSKESLLILMVY